MENLNSENNQIDSALELLREQDTSGALAIFKDILATDPLHLKAQIGAGMCYMESGDYERAEEAFQNAKRLDRTQGFIYYLLGDVYFAREEYSEGLKLYATAKSYGYESARFYHRLGLMHLYFQRDQAAVECFEKGLALEPLHLPLADAIIQVQFKNERYETARKVAEYVIDKHPDQTKGYLWVSKIIYMTEGSQASLDYLKNLVQQTPENPVFHLAYANTLADEGHLKEALEELDRCAETNLSGTINPRAILMQKANIFYASDDLEAYRKTLENAVEHGLDQEVPVIDTEANHLLGKIALAENDPETALLYFERNLYAPVTSEYARGAAFHAGLCLLLLNRREEADECFEISLKIAEGLLPFAEIYEDIYSILALTYLMTGDEEEALRYADIALQKNPYSVDILLLKAALEDSAGDPAVARKVMEEAGETLVSIFKALGSVVATPIPEPVSL